MSCLINYISLSSKIKSIEIADVSNDACKRGKNLKIYKDDFIICINTCSKNQKIEERLTVFEDKYIVNFEGYIDNVEELKNILYKDNRLKVQTNKIVLDAYMKWGSLAPNFIIGSYNFVIINKQSRRIFCARDHLGKKPFFYFYNEEIFVSGSEPKFIFQLNCLKKELNDTYLENFLLQNKNCPSQSYFKNLQKLQKAETIEIFKDSFKRFNYFQFKNKQQYADASIEETSQIFLDTFRQVIDQQLNNSNEFATHLSGGLDSSSVAMMLANLRPDKHIDSYTYDFVMTETKDRPKIDETRYALDVVKKGGFRQHFIKLKYDGIFEALLSDQSIFPEPMTHFNRYLELAVIKQCKKDNIDTVFTGFDGDTVVSYGQELIQKKFSENKIFEALSLYKQSMRNSQKKAKPIKLFIRYYLLKNLPESLHMMYKKTKGLGKFYHHHSLLGEDVKSSIDYSQLLSKQRELQYDYKNGHEKLLNSNLFTQYFETVDTDYSYNGIEEKHPFCDVRLMNLSLNIPLEHKFKKGVSRYLLRHAMKDLLPSSVAKRNTKSNLSPYFFYVIDEKISEIIETLIHSQSKVCTLISKSKLKDMKKNLKNIKPQEKNLLTKYALINSWLEQNFK